MNPDRDIDHERPYRAGGDGPDHETPETQGRLMPGIPDLKRLFTVKEAATYLGTTPAAVYMKVWRGIIPALRDGRRVRIERAELEAYICRRMRPYASKSAG